MNDRVNPAEFDHHSDHHARNWVDDFRTMRSQCPVARSEKHGGYWVVSRYEDVVDVARATDLFSSAKWQDEAGAWQGGLSLPPNNGRIIPDEIDPPQWKIYRHLLNPYFTPKAMGRSKAFAELVASILVDAVIETGRADMVDDLANPLPAIMTMQMMGLPLEQWREYAEPSHECIYTVPGTPEYARAAGRLAWCEQQMAAAATERRGVPGEDLISQIANARVKGELLSDLEILEICRQILGGGVDTTTGLLANVFIHLSRHPDQRRRLAEQPDLAPYACEEFVRFFSPIHTLARTVTADAAIGETPVCAGDRVLIAYGSANRDEDEFDDPDKVQLDRFPNRHIGFGVGVHRCLGSHMARQAYHALMDEVLRRLPDFRVLEDEAEQYNSIGIVNGWVKAPAVFAPGPRENRDPVLAARLRLGA